MSGELVSCFNVNCLIYNNSPSHNSSRILAFRFANQLNGIRNCETTRCLCTEMRLCLTFALRARDYPTRKVCTTKPPLENSPSDFYPMLASANSEGVRHKVWNQWQLYFTSHLFRRTAGAQNGQQLFRLGVSWRCGVQSQVAEHNLSFAYNSPLVETMRIISVIFTLSKWQTLFAWNNVYSVYSNWLHSEELHWLDLYHILGGLKVDGFHGFIYGR